MSFHFGPASSFFLEPFLHSCPVAYWIPANLGGSSSGVIYHFATFSYYWVQLKRPHMRKSWESNSLLKTSGWSRLPFCSGELKTKLQAVTLKVKAAQSDLTLWTIACQPSPSMGFSRQEYWSWLPCPPPGIFPTQGLNLHSSCLLDCRWILYPLSHQGRSVSLRFSLNEAVQIRDEKSTWEIEGP